MTQNHNTQYVPQPSAMAYWNLIKDSSVEVKQTLLNMLYISLKEDNTTNDSTEMSLLSGTWKDERSTEDIIADIRGSRTSNRDLCTLFD